jgi:predicted lipoprotein with Yx(FWY)xxD motif
VRGISIVVLASVAALAVALAGCGGGGGSASGKTAANTTAKRSKAEEIREEEIIAKIPGGPDPQALIQVEKLPGVGRVLADDAHKTLYTFGPDVPGSGKTHCYGACVKVWYPKASYRPPLAGSPSLDQSKFGLITRKEGYRQATYDGYPLYTYIKEKGRMSKGAGRQAFGGTWYALGPNGERLK